MFSFIWEDNPSHNIQSLKQLPRLDCYLKLMLLSMRVDYTVGATLKNKQTLLTPQYTHSAFQLSVF